MDAAEDAERIIENRRDRKTKSHRGGAENAERAKGLNRGFARTNAD